VKALIVEDERKTAAFLAKGLHENGFVADVAENGETALLLVRRSEYDIIILDVMLPGADGWSVVKDLRRRNDATPVLFLTARDAVADLQVDIPRHTATRHGRQLDLTPKEFLLLSLMARRAGEVLSRTLIAEQVWDINFEPAANVVEVHIRRLRTKVDDPFETKLIHTIRGIGYVLEQRA